MDMVKIGKQCTRLVLLTYGLLTYLFLATFNPFLHSYSSHLLQQDCAYHAAHGESDAEDHEPQNSDERCPTCEFLLKAYNATVPEITVPSLNNFHSHSSVFPTYQASQQDNYFFLYLQRAPPSHILS